MAYFGETQLFGAKDSEGAIFSTWTLHGGPSGRLLRKGWLGELGTRIQLGFSMTTGFLNRVADLITDSGAWDLALLTNHLCGEDKKAITSIALGSIAQLGDTNTGTSKKLVGTQLKLVIGWLYPNATRTLILVAQIPRQDNLFGSNSGSLSCQSLLTGRLGEWRELWSYMKVTNPVWCGPSCLGCLDQSNEIDRLCIPLFLIVMVLWTVKEKGEFLLATDSKEAVAMLKGALEWRSNLGNVVEDIRQLMADRGVVDVVFQPRDGNGAAHALA
ncbi:unnamed protein product [Prunus armeniaca]